MFAFLEAQQVEYLVAMASNARLEKRARRLMGRARMLSRATGQTAHLYGETRYAARKWTRRRRVIIKAEVVRHPGRDPKNNPRFVMTNLPDAPETVYRFYCARGDVENRLKELHHGLEMDRTSCSRFFANQFRVLLTLAAYILFQELQRRHARHRLRRCSSHHPARAADQARGVGGALRASDRPALAGDLPVAPVLVPNRARRRRDLVTQSVNWPRGVTQGLVSIARPARPRSPRQFVAPVPRGFRFEASNSLDNPTTRVYDPSPAVRPIRLRAHE